MGFKHTLIDRISRSSVFLRFLQASERPNSCERNVLRVLMYHRIGIAANHPLYHPGLFSATPDAFVEQLDWLSANYQIVSLETLLAAVRGEQTLPARSLMLTFDDACQDFAETAFPLLSTRQLPSTLFVPTGFPGQTGQTFWWDRVYAAISHAPADQLLTLNAAKLRIGQTASERVASFRLVRDYIKSLPHRAAMEESDRICDQLNGPEVPNPVLDWDALGKLSAEGVALAAHTVSHPMLNQLSLEESVDEAVLSREQLRTRVGQDWPVIAYPSGGVTQEIAGALRDAGFEVGYTTRRGLNHIGRTDALLFNRINVGPATSLPLLRAQLLRQTEWLTRRI